MRRRRLWLVLPVVALAVLGFQLHGLTPAASASLPVAPAAVPVQIGHAQRRTLPLWVDAIGTVTSLNTVSVRARVDGQLLGIHFKEGQTVKAGDLLATIDPRPLQVQLAQAQAVQAQEEAKLASNKVDLDRADSLARAGAGPVQTVDTLRAQVATQAATVQAARAAVESARLQLSFTQVTAPAAGRVGQQLAPSGSMVHTADATGIVAITQMNPIWVSFSVPQDLLPQVLQESRSHPLQVVALSRDRSRRLASGELVFVDSQVATTSGQVQLKARFDNAPGSLWPGELVAAQLLVRTQADATVVPKDAVQQGPDSAYVYLVDAQGAAQPRKVVAGAVVDGVQWIQSGLQAGDAVVTQGQYRLAPGVKVVARAEAGGAAR
ncbi:efflux RND transporter periplasmic adaptor subunit [Ramlibacter sp. G-1-2-2]|uniref:Efflux RND transporter periplasmic adaptor subunit n=2 Tax=Ramlibacter agri TaxID=2728837 RepID=A0A848HDW2_9BURK|nr:efflux RND transporter periplasmic adaptor subunit [Ramlibacter agri]